MLWSSLLEALSYKPSLDKLWCHFKWIFSSKSIISHLHILTTSSSWLVARIWPGILAWSPIHMYYSLVHICTALGLEKTSRHLEKKWHYPLNLSDCSYLISWLIYFNMSKPPLVRINLYSHLSQPCSNLTIIKLRLSTTWDGISYNPLIFQTFDIWYTFLTRWLWYITYMSFSAKLLTMNSKECIFLKKFGEFFLAAMYYTKNPYPICYSELHYKYVVCRKKTPIIVITTSCMT